MRSVTRNLGRLAILGFAAVAIGALSFPIARAQSSYDRADFPKVPSQSDSGTTINDPPPQLPVQRARRLAIRRKA